MQHNDLKIVRSHVDNIADKLQQPVDKNIKQLVVALRYACFETVASCEGHLNRGVPYPWVDIALHNGQAQQLLALVEEFNASGTASQPFYLVDFADVRLQPFPRFDEDSQLRISEEQLKQLQADAAQLANYIIKSTGKTPV